MTTPTRPRRPLRSGISLTALALVAGPALIATPPVLAADDKEATGSLEEIVVVGSRRKDRTIADSTVPVDVLGAQELNATGLTETNMLLSQQLPSFNFPQSSVTDGTDHVHPAQLRGLSPDHVLVLVNGKRRHKSALVNLNGSIGRGSNAVDMNMIPANAIKSIEVLRDGAAAQYGSDAIAGVINIILKDQTEGGSASVTYGQYATTMKGVPQLESVSIGDDGNLVFHEGGDRTRHDGATTTIRANYGTAIGEKGYFDLSAEYRDRNPTNRSSYDPREAYSRLDGALDPRELTYDRYNTRYGSSKVEDFSLFYNAGVGLGEFELYSFGSISHRDGESAGFNRLPGNSRNVPAIYPDGYLPYITTDINDMSFAFGLRGAVGGWDSDLSVNYGSDEIAYGVTNSLNRSLGETSPTSFYDGKLKNSQLTFNLDLSKLIETGFLPRPVNVAFGGEYREDNYKITPGEYASYTGSGSQVFPGFNPESAVDGKRHNVAAYLEFDTDLSDKWNVVVAGRFEDYSDFGSTVNGKFATRYQLTDTLAFRGSVSTGFRAPSVAQQYFTSVASLIVDNEVVLTGTVPPSSATATALGSPGLDAEKSVNLSAGLTWQPLDNLNLTVDAYNIKINNRIILSSNLTGDAVAALLANAGVNATSARFFMNGVDTRTRGIDVVATYDTDLGKAGQIKWNVGFNYNDTTVTDVLDPPAVLQNAGFDQSNLFDEVDFERMEKGSPATKLNVGATYLYQGLTVTTHATRYGETWDASATEGRDEILDAAWIVDLDISYQFNDNVSLSIGANNLFDKYPLASATYFGANAGTFDKVFPYSGFSPYGFNGRYLYSRLGIRF